MAQSFPDPAVDLLITLEGLVPLGCVVTMGSKAFDLWIAPPPCLSLVPLETIESVIMGSLRFSAFDLLITELLLVCLGAKAG